MKVKNLRKGKENVQMNLLNLEQRLATQSQYQSQKKVANELAECREERLFNQPQYQKEKIKNESADHIRQERLAHQHQCQNDKNAHSTTITDEIR